MDTAQIVKLFAALQRYPETYLLDGSLSNYVAFINGLDVAMQGQLIDAFDSWLAARVDNRSNSAWPKKILEDLHIDFRWSVSLRFDAEFEAIAVSHMFSLFNEFFRSLDNAQSGNL